GLRDSTAGAAGRAWGLRVVGARRPSTTTSPAATPSTRTSSRRLRRTTLRSAAISAAAPLRERDRPGGHHPHGYPAWERHGRTDRPPGGGRRPRFRNATHARLAQRSRAAPRLR